MDAWLHTHGKAGAPASCACGGQERTAAASPLIQAEDAKRRRDLAGEASALMDGHHDLTRAPWYPTQTGDRLVVTFEEFGDLPGWTETYEVVTSGERGPEPQNELRLVEHSAPEDSFAGGFAGAPEMWGSDAIETAWMEAGAERLALLRDGQVVLHQGRHALTRTTTSGPRITTALGADGAIGAALVIERDCTPAQREELERRIIQRTQEL
ncbi:hypothetical protein ACFVYD_28395 [Streptomyces sp. NPDC058301]|uniref:hypothetical protein n=1 Tax=Streptomyces sp. NPDC058301 TaxID=3346436 RepID=UPI0036EE52B3